MEIYKTEPGGAIHADPERMTPHVMCMCIIISLQVFIPPLPLSYIYILYPPFRECRHYEKGYTVYLLYIIPVRYNTSPRYAVRVDNSWKYKSLRKEKPHQSLQPTDPFIYTHIREVSAHTLLKALLIITKYSWPFSGCVCENRLTTDTNVIQNVYNVRVCDRNK